MKRYNSLLLRTSAPHPETIRTQTAIHEAGHAAAIYLGNRQKGLPPVYFQILIKDIGWENPAFCATAEANLEQLACYAKVEGGRLIHTLPSSQEETARHFSPAERQAYLTAYEADIVNFLVGPLSEAKYVASRDNELFNPRLVTLEALQFYGGEADLELAEEYLDCLYDRTDEKTQKINELFLEAYRFIGNRSNWRAITQLADYIVQAGKKTISCEEIIQILEPFANPVAV